MWTKIVEPRVSGVTLTVLVTVLAVDPLFRGIDYVIGDGPSVTKSLTHIEASAPLWVWGSVCLFVVAMSMLGIFAGRYEPLIAGSLLGFALYATFAVGLGVNVWERGWPPDGFRTPIMFLQEAALWLIIGFDAIIGRSIQLDHEEGRNADTGGAAR